MCIFSNPAMGFFRSVIDFSFTVSPQKASNFLLDVYQRSQGDEDPEPRKGFLTKDILKRYQFQIEPEVQFELLKSVWKLEDPVSRIRLVCCRDKLVQQMSLIYVEAFEKAWPGNVGAMLEYVFKKQCALPGQDPQRFRPLGQYLIQSLLRDRDLALIDLEERQYISNAWDLVRGRHPALKWPGDLSEQLSFEDQLCQIVAESREEEDRMSLLKNPSFDDLWELCFEAFQDTFGESKKRPYICLYDHAYYGLLLVMGSIGGHNSAGNPVYAGSKFGHSGEKETTQKEVDSVFQTIWGTTHDNAKTNFRAVPYVEGGYGKCWINVQKNGVNIDVFKEFFVLKNKAIHLVSEEEYERRKRLSREENKPKLRATFDVDPEDEGSV